MTSNALPIRWSSVFIASLSVWVLSFVLVAGVIFAYAFSLGWAARGAPDSETIQRFADSIAPAWTARLGVVLTGIAALWLGRVNTRPISHGILIGLIVAGTPLIVRQRVSLAALLTLGVTLLAGAIGGWLGSQIKRQHPLGEHVLSTRSRHRVSWTWLPPAHVVPILMPNCCISTNPVIRRRIALRWPTLEEPHQCLWSVVEDVSGTNHGRYAPFSWRNA